MFGALNRQKVEFLDLRQCLQLALRRPFLVHKVIGRTIDLLVPAGFLGRTQQNQNRTSQRADFANRHPYIVHMTRLFQILDLRTFFLQRARS